MRVHGGKASLYLSLHPLTAAVGDTPAKLLLRRGGLAAARERDNFSGVAKNINNSGVAE